MDAISFRKEFGLWWPVEESGEKLFHYMMNRVTDVDVAIKHVRTKGVAVQAGGFIGMWPIRLNKFFERVYTFEPRNAHFKCIEKNIKNLPGILARQCVLGPTMGQVQITPKNGGCTTVSESGTVTVEQITIDSLNLVRCDAIFLDVERYELPALEGALETIKRFSPVITVEQKEDTNKEYLAWFKKQGYELRERVHGDWVFVRK